MSIFDSRRMNEAGISHSKDFRECFNYLWRLIESKFDKPSRDLSIVKTNLEDACMWAIKALSYEYEDK